MAEKVVSPGVFTNEIDQSFLPAAVGEIGAAVIGPTAKGPAMVPTVVTSYSEFQQKFGDTFKSGSKYYSYLTSVTAQNYLKHSGKMTVVRIMSGSYSYASSSVFKSGSTTVASFKVNTHGDGAIENSSGSTATGYGTNQVLESGSKDNLRWETTSVNETKGTFTLLIRRGNDTIKRKQVLETWNNLSLDPNSNNYISKIIGNQKATIRGTGTDAYIEYSGSYPNKSKYVWVSDVEDTVDYLNENGVRSDEAYTGSLPAQEEGQNSGSFFGGSDGDVAHPQNFYDNIAQQTQGFNIGASWTGGSEFYQTSLDLLSNQDEYDVNLIMMPGIAQNLSNHSQIVSKAFDVCEDRGDCFVIADPTGPGEAQSTAVTSAEAYDSNYGAMYYPWVQTPDLQLGRNVWVPPSAVLPGIYAFNDKVAHPWFAPAGLNRGGIDTAIQAERKLTHNNRDTLYEAGINPIATFPGQGVTVWGQKTLQKKASALDRVNVRRLMIKLKKFIASSSRFLVFEQNNSKTRNRFLNIVNPFLEQVQSNSGLNAFKVVMDETNNTPDTIDRNILFGQIFVQPTRTAEFIVLDFTVQPTGATFPE